MNEQLYRANILEHFKSPHHWGKLGKTDMTHMESNPTCGDEIGIDIKVDKSGKITDVGLSGSGCAISVAAASMLSDRIIGMKIKDIVKLDKKIILSDLGIDPGPARMRCALLALEGVRKMIAEKRKG